MKEKEKKLCTNFRDKLFFLTKTLYFYLCKYFNNYHREKIIDNTRLLEIIQEKILCY